MERDAGNACGETDITPRVAKSTALAVPRLAGGCGKDIAIRAPLQARMRTLLCAVGACLLLASCADPERVEIADVNARNALEENGKLRSRIDELESRMDALEEKVR